MIQTVLMFLAPAPAPHGPMFGARTKPRFPAPSPQAVFAAGDGLAEPRRWRASLPSVRFGLKVAAESVGLALILAACWTGPAVLASLFS